ncbi:MULTISPECIES: hypothetical protein [unclassified Moorena]|uniref:hypothetical protein n=1 Tax=unclassified Moorena TaxID=2683338 RepID=UPI0013BA9EFE|nr:MULTISPECIES: hypothetical protein [unclassified Moorena]NER91031.1 hypothetical protein [Moorena sp. SIO3A2]NES83101.1 hypothetical protein [Moorena sp. SIO2B7]NET68007.1 hypothetical protein [Moorena sp. SIO1G6]
MPTNRSNDHLNHLINCQRALDRLAQIARSQSTQPHSIPGPITEREEILIYLYSNCRLSMTPQEFYWKWQVNQEDIANICCRSTYAVNSWLAQGARYKTPSSDSLHHLALMDFLLENFEAIPKELLNQLCSKVKSC